MVGNVRREIRNCVRESEDLGSPHDISYGDGEMYGVIQDCIYVEKYIMSVKHHKTTVTFFMH